MDFPFVLKPLWLWALVDTAVGFLQRQRRGRCGDSRARLLYRE
jgi:hypothetical protein